MQFVNLYQHSEVGVLTEHLTDIRLNIHILQMLKCVGMEKSEGGVQTDRYPDAISIPRQLSHLALLTRVGIKGFLHMRIGT